MRINEAKKLLEEKCTRMSFDIRESDDIIELSKFLYEKTDNVMYLQILASEYLYRKKSDLALKYMELTYEKDIYEAGPLANFYYSGEFIKPDYKKAYEYLKVALTLKDKEGDGSFNNVPVRIEDNSLEMLADMYEKGNYLKKDTKKAEEIIKGLYEKYKCLKWYDVRIDIFMKMADIKEKEGEIGDALEIWLDVVDDASCLLRYDVCADCYEKAELALKKIYEYIAETYDTYMDLIEALNRNYNVRIMVKGKQYDIITEIENNDVSVYFDGKWFRSVKDFITGSKSDDKRLIEMQDDIEILEVLK